MQNFQFPLTQKPYDKPRPTFYADDQGDYPDDPDQSLQRAYNKNEKPAFAPPTVPTIDRSGIRTGPEYPAPVLAPDSTLPKHPLAPKMDLTDFLQAISPILFRLGRP